MTTECCEYGGELIRGGTCLGDGNKAGNVKPTFRERRMKDITLTCLHARAIELIGPEVHKWANLGCEQEHFTLHLRGMYDPSMSWPHIHKLDLNRDRIPVKELDCILCLDVIEHLENPYKLVRDCHAALRDGGELIISIPNLHSFMSRLLYLFRGQFTSFQNMDLSRSDHINPIQFWELQHILKTCGFDIDTVDCHMFFDLDIVVKAIKRGDGALTARSC